MPTSAGCHEELKHNTMPLIFPGAKRVEADVVAAAMPSPRRAFCGELMMRRMSRERIDDANNSRFMD
jgi:hypothetical protein